MIRKSSTDTSPRRLVAAGVGVGAAILLAACQSGASAVPSIPSVSSIALPSALPSTLPQAFVQFTDQTGSGITGGAVLTDSSGQTAVVIAIIGGDTSAAMPAVLFEGDCTSFPGTGTPPASEAPSASESAATGSESPSPSASSEAPSSSAGAQFELEDVVNGTSTSTVPASLSELTGSPHSIAILAASAASMAPESMAPESAAPASAMASESPLAEAPSAGSSASIVACGEITTVPPPDLQSLFPGASGAPSGSAAPSASTEGSTEPSPSS